MRSKGFIGIFLLILLVVAVTGGYFVYTKTSMPSGNTSSSTVRDAFSAIAIVEANPNFQKWKSQMDNVEKPQADIREGKWRVYYQGIKNNTGDWMIIFYVDPKTGGIASVEEPMQKVLLNVPTKPPVTKNIPPTTEELQQKFPKDTMIVIEQIRSLLKFQQIPYQTIDTTWEEETVTIYLYGLGFFPGTTGSMAKEKTLSSFDSIHSFLLSQGFAFSNSTQFYPGGGNPQQQGRQYKKNNTVCDLFSYVYSESNASLEVKCGDMSIIKLTIDSSKIRPE